MSPSAPGLDDARDVDWYHGSVLDHRDEPKRKKIQIPFVGVIKMMWRRGRNKSNKPGSFQVA